MTAPAIPIVHLCSVCGINPVSRKHVGVVCGPCELAARPSEPDHSRDYTVAWEGNIP